MESTPIQLGKNQERRLRAGHCWVYSNEVDSQRSPLPGFEAGQPVTVSGWRTDIAFGGAPVVDVTACGAAVRLQDAVLLPTAHLANAAMEGVIEAYDDELRRLGAPRRHGRRR